MLVQAWLSTLQYGLKVTFFISLSFLQMAALGHKRSFIAILQERPLPGVKRPYGDRILHTFKLMSAFLQSGRSERQNLPEIRVRFRPEADIVGLGIRQKSRYRQLVAESLIN